MKRTLMAKKIAIAGVWMLLAVLALLAVIDVAYMLRYVAVDSSASRPQCITVSDANETPDAILTLPYSDDLTDMPRISPEVKGVVLQFIRDQVHAMYEQGYRLDPNAASEGRIEFIGPKAKLVSLEEWEEQILPASLVYEHKNGIACPECGTELYDDTTSVLLSCPPQYPIFCKKCGFIGSRH